MLYTYILYSTNTIKTNIHLINKPLDTQKKKYKQTKTTPTNTI